LLLSLARTAYVSLSEPGRERPSYVCLVVEWHPLARNAFLCGYLCCHTQMPTTVLLGFPIVLAKFTLLRNYTFFHKEF
jgi:hypothetical protein